MPLHDWWREPDAAYLVTRWIHGGSLAERLARGQVGPADALRWTEQVGAALAAAHREGVVHGDVRASNVVLDADGQAYLTDFAIGFDPAARHDRTAPPPDLRSLAPERRDGAAPSRAGDVYAFGILLADLFTPPTVGPDGRDLRIVLERATAARPTDRPASAAEVVAAVRGAILSPSAAGSALSVPSSTEPLRNPYKGLRPFEEEDAADFFGREELVTALLGRLAGPGPAPLLAVVGPSGSGKSSVVRAGLIPALRNGALPGSSDWFVASLTPGERPFESLEAAILGVAVGAPIALAELVEDPAGLRRAVDRVLPPGGQLLLVIDQFEELFTLCDDETDRERFLGVLAATVADPASRVRIVVTLRADFYDRPLRHERFGRQLAEWTQVVLPATPEELERVVAEPAARAGLRLEPGLVARIVAETADQPGGLPLLQFALSELWEHREAGRLSLRAYESSGGIAGAVARRAEELVGGLDDEARETTRQVFLRLVELGEGVPDTGRRVRHAELRELDRAGDRIDAVVESFARYRLLMLDRDPETRERTVELAHEALLHAWPRLRRWVDDAREDLRQERRLAAAAGGWLDAGREPSFLLSGARLEHFEQWAAATPVALTREERAYLEASLAERDRLARIEAERRTHEAILERRALTRLRAVVVVLALGVLVAGVLSLLAFTASRRAEREARISSARELAAAALANLAVDPELSVLLALEAVDTTRRADGSVLREAEEALRRATKGLRLVHTVDDGRRHLGVSPDGARFARAREEGGVTIWETLTGARSLDLPADGGEPLVAAFDPGGRWIATGASDGVLRIWDATTGRRIARHDLGRGPVSHLAFDPAGRWLVADHGEGGEARVVDVESGSVAIDLSGIDIWRPVFSPDGIRLAGGQSPEQASSALVVDVETGRRVVLSGHVWSVPEVAFSPDGASVATASVDGSAGIWDARTGVRRESLYGHHGSVWSIAWSADGRSIATGGSDGTARLWDARTGRHELTLAGHVGGLTDVAFAADGGRLVTADEEVTRVWDVTVGGARDWLTVRAADLIYVGVAFSPDGALFAAPAEPTGVSLWDTRTGRLVAALAGETKLTSVTFSPDGRRIAAGSDLTFEPPVWDVASGRLLFTLRGHRATVRSVAFSPDGRRLATGSWDGSVALWDARTGARLVERPSTDRQAVIAVTYSPDGTLLATGSAGGELTLWNAAALEPLRSVAVARSEVIGIAFGPGDLLVTAGGDGAAKIWRTSSLEAPILTLRGHAGPVNQVALSPDGALVATAGDDGVVKLWERASGREQLTLHSHDLVAYGVAFSPDGRLLATGAADGTVGLHLLPIDEFVELARSRVTRRLTDAECARYLHLAACPPGSG